MSVLEQQDEPTPQAAVPLHRRLRGGRTLRDGRRLYWWGELLAVAVFYVVYSFVRNLHHGNEHQAFEHALDVIRLQKSLGIYHEQAVQAWALGSRTFIIAANYFYGSLHFIVTGGVMVYPLPAVDQRLPALAQHARDRHRARADRLRVLPAHASPPARRPSHYGFVDTLAKDPTFWSFNSGAVSKISNQYAAMPSVHCSWALWCALRARASPAAPLGEGAGDHLPGHSPSP